MGMGKKKTEQKADPELELEELRTESKADEVKRKTTTLDLEKLRTDVLISKTIHSGCPDFTEGAKQVMTVNSAERENAHGSRNSTLFVVTVTCFGIATCMMAVYMMWSARFNVI